MADTYLNKKGAQHRAEKTKEWADARFVRYTTYNAVGVAGSGKNVSVLSPQTLFVPDGLIMGGTALSAGLVTRGICGVTTPDGKGGCTKENLYLNYDGNNNYSRKVVLGAGSAGNEIANSSGAYTYSAVRGDQMVSYVTNYVPGAIKTWFDSNVHIPSIKTLNTNNSSTLPVSSSEARSGSGSINLHKVSKTGKFSDLNNRGEAFLSWGGQNFAGSYGPIDSAMIPDLGANRLAFMPPAGISVEYSRDSGTTWQDYGATGAQKLALTSTGVGFIIGKADSSNKATETYMLRISLHTSEGKVYTQLNKFALYVSTNGSNGSYCTIRARTQNNYLNKVDKWDVFANKQSISGWSGWNIINTSTITTFGNTASSQYGEIQFIFGCTSGSTSYVGLQILRLMGFGGVGWTTPSTMAKTGHIYTYDTSQNVTFPAAITSGIVNSYNILPRGNNTYNLGSNSSKWANIYATTIYENGNTLSKTYVKYSAEQSLTDNQKVQARKNIGAGAITEIKVNGTSKGTSGSVNLTNMVTFASSQTVTVAGTSKKTYTYNQPTGDSNTSSSNGSAYFPEGIIMGGTAASAGLVTRGICGVITPDATTGACNKENLYINYDGNNTYQNNRQLVLQAGTVGTHYGYNLYEYAAARGDAVKNYCDAIYAKKSDVKSSLSSKADLDSTGKVPSSQLPSYVDDVEEYTSQSSFPATGTTGKIYVDTTTNLTFRWSGTEYVVISPSLALGETSSTAYAGNKGAENAKNIQTILGYFDSDGKAKTAITAIAAINDGNGREITATYVNKTVTSTESMAGSLFVAGSITSPSIATGDATSSYFQSRKFRGEGNAATYYHAVDFGFAGHNQVDFYEYGGLWNFWKNQNSTPTTDSNNLCLQIGDTYVKNKGNTFTWPTTSGTLALTSNIPESLKNPYSMTIKAGADTISSYDGSASKTFTVAASTTAGAFTISDGTTTKTIQLAGKFTDTDTNTATAADNILDGSNNGTQITYAPYAAQQSKLSFDTSTTAPTRTDRLNLNGYLYATKFNVAGKAAVQYNSTEDCIEFIFA